MSIITQTEGKKKIPTLNGGYVLSKQQYKGFVSKQDLIGMKWVENKATVMFFPE
ncbi:hypothetical protein KEH51_21170 [[Brevibacterium] frigoritolerans]|uniref:Uncharacterized protein n=1 Tax=Peribacillus frigoritolerans TaxID=450367 RepID=A0A941FK17_9BACI|nr:hypothetical protein [Peribacillus frigoritolerans]